jgi:hypothetical protein
MSEPPAPAGGVPPAQRAAAHLSCALCPEGGPPASVGPLGELVGPFRAGGGVYEACWVHKTCAEWTPEVYWDGDQLRNVAAAIQRGKHLLCAKCGGKGATLGCIVAACTRSYHYACARAGTAKARGVGGVSLLKDLLVCQPAPSHSRL